MGADHELRQAELLLADPHRQDGLSDSIPPETGIAEVLNTYVFERWPVEKAWCAKCQGHRHKYGFTAELSDGSKVMLGSKCGADAFGKSWRELHKLFKERLRRQSYLLRLDALGPRLLAIGSELLEWQWHARRFQESVNRFRLAMGPLFEALRQAARKDGALDVFVQIEAKERAKWHGGRSSEWVSATYHRIEGRQFLCVSNPEAIIASALETVNELSAILVTTDQARTTELVRLSKAYSEMTERLHRFAEGFDAWPRFIREANLAKIAEWATQTEAVPGSYETKGACLIWVTEGKAVHLNAGYTPLDKKLLRQLVAEDDQRELPSQLGLLTT